jgi:hypothetical protein
MKAVVFSPDGKASLKSLKLNVHVLAAMSVELNDNKHNPRLSFSVSYGEFIRRYRLIARGFDISVNEKNLMFLGPKTPEQGLYKYRIHFVFPND